MDILFPLCFCLQYSLAQHWNLAVDLRVIQFIVGFTFIHSVIQICAHITGSWWGKGIQM